MASTGLLVAANCLDLLSWSADICAATDCWILSMAQSARSWNLSHGCHAMTTRRPLCCVEGVRKKASGQSAPSLIQSLGSQPLELAALSGTGDVLVTLPTAHQPSPTAQQLKNHANSSTDQQRWPNNPAVDQRQPNPTAQQLKNHARARPWAESSPRPPSLRVAAPLPIELWSLASPAPRLPCQRASPAGRLSGG